MKKDIFPFMILISLACLSLTGVSLIHPDPFLTEGNVILYDIYYPSGIKKISSVTIKEVVEINSCKTVKAEELIADSYGGKTGPYILKYYSDSSLWCEDMINYLYVILSDDPSAEYSLESDSLVYPLNMKVGDSLASASARVISTVRRIKVDDKRMMYDRIVVAMDTVRTEAGSILAFKIESKIDINSYTNHASRANREDNYLCTCTVWFAPSIGVIKREFNSKYGRASTVLQSYSK